MDKMEEVVICGISGRFPESNTVDEFWQNLISAEDMVTEDDRRWKPGLWGLPRRNGKLPEIDKFDASFFGVHAKQANNMDPQQRMLLEVSYEAIYDAGIDPTALAGSNTGVWVGVSSAESKESLARDPDTLEGYVMTGCCTAMFSNRISFFYDLKGPSMTVDTACSSSLLALQMAFDAIKNGKCESAIVAGSNLVLKPQTSLQFQRLGMLSNDGACRSFDADGKGYVRSETVAAIYICKKSLAKRMYCSVLNAVTNTDGNKEQGITFPSGDMQKKLIRSAFEGCSIDPSSVAYMEAHGTGTKAGDPQEVNAIVDVLCTEKRTSPLLIGSVKSNMGHAEPASGLASVAKCILAMENRIIPPNLHYDSPNLDIPGLSDGRLKVVDEPTTLPDGVVCINSFGFGGSNVHVILRPCAEDQRTGDEDVGCPQLLFLTGRTENGIKEKCHNLTEQHLSRESVDFVNKASTLTKSSQPYRGYVIKNIEEGDEVLSSASAKVDSQRRPVWFIMTGMGAQWKGMGCNLMKIPIFRHSIDKCSNALADYNIDVANLLLGADDGTFDDTVNAFVALASIQVGIIDVLTACGVVPDGMLGHFVGELACGYADKSLTLGQTIKAAYCRGKCIKDSDLPVGGMAAVGLSWKECKKRCPEGVSPACHNAADSVTVSGPEGAILDFVSQLKEEGVFAKHVKSSGVAFHSPSMAKVHPVFVEKLRKIIPEAKPRSDKWISSSIAEEEWGNSWSRFCSAEYHANNLVSPVLFQEALKHVPENAVVVEIAPHALLQAILKRSLPPSCTLVPLTKRFCKSELTVLQAGLGKLYINGINITLGNVWPSPSAPPPRGTVMLSSLVDWDHRQSWQVPTAESFITGSSGRVSNVASICEISTQQNSPDNYLNGHCIDGRVLYPATGYLVLTWKTLARYFQLHFEDLPVVFEDVTFHRATVLSDTENTKLEVCIIPSSQEFRISEGESLVVSGKIRSLLDEDADGDSAMHPASEPPYQNGKLVLMNSELYRMLRLRGYQYRNDFQGLQAMHQGGEHASVVWTGNWVTFLDTILQAIVLSVPGSELRLPTRIRKLVLNPQGMISCDDESTIVNVHMDSYLDTTTAGSSVQISGLRSTSVPRRPPSVSPTLEEYKFVTLYCVQKDNSATFSKTLLDVALENRNSFRSVKVLDVLLNHNPDALLEMYQHLNSHLLIDVEYTVAGSARLAEVNAYSQFNFVSWDPMHHPAPSNSTEDFDIIFLHDALKLGNGLIPNACSALKSSNGLLMLTEGLDSEEEPNDFETDQQHLETILEDYKEKLHHHGLQLIGGELRPGNSVTLLCKRKSKSSNCETITITNDDFTWVDTLKEKLLRSENKDPIWLIGRQSNSGIVGMINCLRQEPGGDRIRCLFDTGSSKETLSADQIKQVIHKDLVINVYRDNAWGTFRHVPFMKPEEVKTSRGYVDTLTRGDLASLKWITDPEPQFNKECTVAFAALNFRDVMLASGKLPPDAIPGDTSAYKTLIGMEFSGWDHIGKRVMGLLPAQGLATHVTADRNFTWEIPEGWSLEQACTVPVVYATAYYALIVRGNLRPGESVLVHCGSGGVGQAAISIALSKGCTVFTTVSTQKKRKYLLDRFPELTEECFSSSRFLTFEQDIMRKTKGKGVDLVLNSLSGEKLLASARCVARHGRFLEIGKYDLANNSKLGMSLFLRNVSFHGILLDSLFEEGNQEWKQVSALMKEGLENGTTRPLGTTVFSRDEVENAFRYMAQGKHIGKVVIRVRENEEEIFEMEAVSRANCRSDRVYLITGGLGGFGLELCNWLVGRGARKLVLTSRSGVKTAYQQKYIDMWRKMGVEIIISSLDVGTLEGTKELLEFCLSISPVAGVFHLAMVLQDALLENQTADSFKQVCHPKSTAMEHLDLITRQTCPNLDWFVGFSSVVSGRGNAGQSNYGFSNSCMERICEKRHEDGLPGLAIQWGAIGDVGVLIDTLGDREVGGTLPQKMFSCLSVLDTFLCQKNSAVVSSFVAAPKKSKVVSNKDGNETSIVHAIANILGMQDISSIDKNCTLGNLGLDSLMSVEVQQTLERTYGIALQAKDIRSLTFAKISEFEKGDERNAKTHAEAPEKGAAGDHADGLGTIDSNVAKEFGILPEKGTASQTIVQLNFTANEESPWFLIHPIEGTTHAFYTIAEKLRRPVYGVQCTSDAVLDSIPTLASYYLKKIREVQPTGPYKIAGYSFGACVAFEMALQLQKESGDASLIPRLVLLDSSHSYVASRVQAFANIADQACEKEAAALAVFLKQLLPNIESYVQLKDYLVTLESFNDRLDHVIRIVQKHLPHAESEHIKSSATRYYQRLAIGYEYRPEGKYHGNAVLIRTSTKQDDVNLEQDYGLSEVCSGHISVDIIDTEHKQLLQGAHTNKILDVMESD